MKLESNPLIWGLLRLGLGWIFLWSFIDKLWGLGFSTEAGSGWLAGGSPTFGYLSFATKGPFAGIFQAMATSTLVEWLFMLGLLLIGLSLLLGIGVRVAGYSAALMYVLMYLAGAMPPEHNPFLDEHIMFAILSVGFALSPSGEYLGFGKWWKNQKFVKKNPWLI
ncbi:MAG: hypothetical protein Q8P30_04840 [Candidatus Uhrbacteria bacterium]|nr:hypothetical protein [Candidatus Uhrbacteria bacterium]